jgi:hypothetical protein
MTVEPTSKSNVPALDDDLDTGLDDFGMEDAVVPRLSIVHKEAEFKDSLSGMTFPSVKVIILGLVKQRILWHTDIEDNSKPMCKSPDHRNGFPNLSDDVPRDRRFPWQKSGFRPEDYKPDSNGQVALPCDGCQLKEWGSHPDGKRPYCSEQFTLPVMYDPYDNESWVPALMTFQKTGIKPVRSYLTSFARSQNPAYTAITEISLNLQHRGQTDYSVPSFKRIADTEPDMWREFSTSFKTLKGFLQAPPSARESEDEESGTVVSQQASTPEPEAKKASPSPASNTEPDDDLPF